MGCDVEVDDKIAFLLIMAFVIASESKLRQLGIIGHDCNPSTGDTEGKGLEASRS